ncbi:MAG: type VI secretion system contractile sheath large subunit [Phycisphaerales bacterium]|nr:type VI secretion system contractile sheath large subunit [Phycisphaerales bacterium]
MHRRILADTSFSFGFSGAGAPKREPERPFRVLVLADFSGSAAHGDRDSLATRQILRADIDNIDALMQRLDVRVPIPVGDRAYGVGIHTLDQLHPEELFADLELFAALRNLRARLSDPSRFKEAADEIRSMLSPQIGSGPASLPASSDPAGSGSEADDFSKLLSGEAVTAGESRPAIADDLIRAVVGPHIVPAADPKQAEFVAALDRAISAEMRAILRSDGFRTVETAWRSLHTLITRLETDETLTIDILDLSKAELEADLAGGPGASALAKLLLSDRVGDEPWSVICPVHRFGPGEHDARTLRGLGAIGASCGGPVIASIDPDVAGCASVAASPEPESWGEPDEAFVALRATQEASWLMLTTPRVMVRLPYGGATDPIDAFDFEEIEPEALGTARAHEAYLWGPASVGVVALLGERFSMQGWGFDASTAGDFDTLPMHALPDGRVVPSAEAYLGERASARLRSCGLIPVLSIKGRDAARFGAMQTINGGKPPIGSES